jgi:uncharacterized membrane protein YphA (DoxX/SURF4 family)
VSALRHPVVRRALGVLLGGVFVYASLDKIAHPAEFARIVYHYQLIGPSAALPPVLPNLLAVVLPWIELVVGLCLIAGVWTREAAVAAGLMLVAFIGAVGSALARGIDIENCGCFTVTEAGRAAGLKLILGDLALLAVAALLAFRTAEPATLPSTEAAPAAR